MTGLCDEIVGALAGHRGADQQRLAQAGIDLVVTLLRKNADYGSSAWQPPLLKPGMSAGDAIFVRMGDKVARIASLAGKPAEVAGESLADTVKDLAGYAVLWLARPEETNSQEYGGK